MTSCATTCRATRTTTPTRPTTRAARRATRTTCAARSCGSSPGTTRPDRPARATRTTSRRATCSRRARRSRGPRSTRWGTGTRSGSRSIRRPAGSTTARSGPTPTTTARPAARAATTRSTRSARRALLWWPYTPYPAGFPFPGIPTGPGRTAIAGPTYHFEAANPSEKKFPAFYDDKVFFADWSRDCIATMTLTPDGTTPAEIKRFMPYTDFRHVQDMEMGADGSLYILEWGRDFNFAGQGINPDSGLYRIDFVKGKRSPVARAAANRDTGPAPLEVSFSSEGSDDPDGDDLTYEWNFGDGTPVSNEPNPTHSFDEPGQYTVRLLVTDTTGKSGTSTLVITAGNTRPTVDIEIPEQGGVHGWGDGIDFRVRVTDPEDDPIDCSRVEVAPGVFHDEGGNAHVHPGVNENGCEGTFEAPADSGHEKNAVIALVVTATHAGGGAPGGAPPPLLGADTHRLNPNQMQAEHFNEQSGVTIEDRVGAEGGRRTASSAPGDWIYFDPVSLKGIDELRIRYTAAAGTGGVVQLRLRAPPGGVVGA